MSFRQVFIRLQHQLAIHIRHVRPAAYQLPKRAAKVARSLKSQGQDPATVSSSQIQTRNFLQRWAHSLLTPRLVPRWTSLLRVIGTGPVRTTAPLLGFIAAFLQESKTEKFRVETAFSVVREGACDLAKKSPFFNRKFDCSQIHSISDLDFGKPLGKGCNAAVYEARLQSDASERMNDPQAAYDLAVKLIFNYSMHSDAEEIQRMFDNELIPARLHHANIISVFQAVIDRIPSERLPESAKLFPCALPENSIPGAVGRSQTMFVLMDKLSTTLRDELIARKYRPFQLKEGLRIFAQLLEAVSKLVRENVAHRDIKSDNVLIGKQDDGSVGQVVLSDFGCGLDSLRLHYVAPYISRGGNRALMAPEVVNAEPGLFSFIDYSRSDLWAVGTLAYEIFKGYNPFYEGVFKLDSADYQEERLPEAAVGEERLNKLVWAILRRDPKKRPSGSVAATACQLLLWDFPFDTNENADLDLIHVWILQLCVLLFRKPASSPDFVVLSTFLKRLKVEDVMAAVKLLRP